MVACAGGNLGFFTVGSLDVGSTFGSGTSSIVGRVHNERIELQRFANTCGHDLQILWCVLNWFEAEELIDLLCLTQVETKNHFTECFEFPKNIQYFE